MHNRPDGIWIIGSDARTLYASAAMGEILGTSAVALIGKHSFDFIFPEDITAARGMFERKQRGDKRPFHFRLRRENGSPVWVDVLGTPMTNVAGQFIGIVGTFSVSERQGLERRKQPR